MADSYKKDTIEACLAVKNPLIDLTDFMKRLEAVSKLNSKAFLESANRIIKILKSDVNEDIKTDLFKDESENMLFEQISKINSENISDYDKYIAEITDLTPYIEKFFENVLVMDNDEKIKTNRLSILTKLKKLYEKVADFSKLQ